MSASTELSATAGVKLAYSELRRLAAAYLRGEQRGRTLEPAALVHEAYIRLACWDGVYWKSRSHFVGVAAMVMRQVIWSHARRRNASKRRADGQRVTLHSGIAGGIGVDAFYLEDALRRLEVESTQACRVVEMRVFGGLTIAEIASLLDLSESTVKRQWVFAKTWLRQQLEGQSIR
ncbi:MAG: RNA polymerase subunit sigma-70 [Acidobacteria bacterium]|nr:RNA polymerase subunit sigma-70 [Acidobacteriota bacterium]